MTDRLPDVYWNSLGEHSAFLQTLFNNQQDHLQQLQLQNQQLQNQISSLQNNLASAASAAAVAATQSLLIPTSLSTHPPLSAQSREQIQRNSVAIVENLMGSSVLSNLPLLSSPLPSQINGQRCFMLFPL